MLIEELDDEAVVCGQTLNKTDSHLEGDTDLYPNKLIEQAGLVRHDLFMNPCSSLCPSTVNEKRERNPVNSQHLAVKLFVGAGARLLFYPTLFYNVVRNKFEADFRWWDEIEPFLLLGAVPFPKDVYRLKSLGVEAVITLNESYETLVSSSLYKSQKIKHLVIPTRDYLFAPSFEDIERAVDFIHRNIERGKATYVHCKAGRGRSTTIVLCYLVKYRGMAPFDAFNHVRLKRPRIQLAASQWKAVLRYSEYQLNQRCTKLAPFIFVPQHWPICKNLQDGVGDQIMAPSEYDITFCGDSPVLVTLSDLEGYEERKELCSDNEFQENQTFNMTLSCGALSDVRSQSGQPMVSLHMCQQGLVKC
ncbi:hypothetical protein GOP47_0003065 [Adiantum capillus-veneris]|uniref:phosphatidylglycerophosphatase n=1 Tax=Adiantum capillus-veneris TaxID=13818 RepID=A0A9D4VD97_ADICA|nr:hypothetical protein GOP47_0003065 [Adiantum capillus-veneris]